MIRPRERFSYWMLVGNTTKIKDYLNGLEIYRGKITSGIGEGVCQISNKIYWMTLHTDLDVIERHTHAFDAFPDNKRTIPFGSGATVSYNYYDLVLENNTYRTYQFHFWMNDEFLFDQIRNNELEPHNHHIQERNHRFHFIDGQYFRENELWRQTHDPSTGNLVMRFWLLRTSRK
jgi:vancomycin resistance protein VanW